MTEIQKIRQKVLFETFDKYPNLPNRTTAKLIYSKYPELFNDIEHCRSIVRNYRGSNGNQNRIRMTTTKYYKNEI